MKFLANNKRITKKELKDSKIVFKSLESQTINDEINLGDVEFLKNLTKSIIIRKILSPANKFDDNNDFLFVHSKGQMLKKF